MKFLSIWKRLIQISKILKIVWFNRIIKNVFVFKYNFNSCLNWLSLTEPTAMFNGQFLFDRPMHVKMVSSYISLPLSKFFKSFICYPLCYRSFLFYNNLIIIVFANRMTSLSLMKTIVHMTVKHRNYLVSKSH